MDDGTAIFDWGSDIDEAYGRHWLTNFIHNKRSDSGWSGYWKKGNIEIALSRPLKPQKAVCRQSLAGDCEEYPIDTDAPIVYGSNDMRQDAAVFVPNCDRITKAFLPSLELFGQFEADDHEDGAVDLSVSIDFLNKGDGLIQLGVDFSPEGYTVGVSGLVDSLGKDRFESLLKRAKEEGREVQNASFSDLFSEIEANDYFLSGDFDAKRDFTFFKNAFYFLMRATESSESLESEVVVLDGGGVPILRSSFTIPVME